MPRLLLVFLFLTFSDPASSYQRPIRYSFKVIVHPNNPAVSITKKVLSDIYLKKITLWPDKTDILSVDLAISSNVRKQFTEEVLNRTVVGVKSYWQQMIFTGRSLPPPEFDDEKAVVLYVKQFPGAIGYVSIFTETDGLKILDIN